MLEAYTLNATVGAGSAIPFNNVSLEKGCSVINSGPSSIELNRCGVYMVSFNGVASSATTVQMYKNEIVQPQAQTFGTNLSFETLVQVAENNTKCCCSSPTTLRFVNNGTSATFPIVNLNVTKIC